MVKKEFRDIKESILTLCEGKKEITPQTNYKNGGIYMLYVDDFSDEKIIPFYIGKTHNFQERHKNHMKEILALNRLKKDYYVAAIINKYFEGHYKSCKLFKYLVDKDCKLKDIRMIVLEECEDETKRAEIEQDYINKYLAPFLGFNQINSITLSLEKNSKYLENIKTDIYQIKKYAKYGFNRFNYIVSKNIFENHEKDLYNQLKKIEEFKEIDEKIEENRKKTQERQKMLNYVGNYHSKSLDECEKVCINFINVFFEENGLKSDDKKKQIIRGLIYNLDKDIKEVKQYIERFSKGSKEDIFRLVLENTDKDEIERIKNKVTKYLKYLPNNEEDIIELRKSIFRDIVPKKEYTSFPLKDLFEEKDLNANQNREDNTLYINIEFSNMGRKARSRDDYPVPLKIDYDFYKGYEHVRNTYFIESIFDNFFEEEYYYVIERSKYDMGKFDAFNIGKRGGKTIDYSSISTSMEYYNGINEYTLKDKEKHKFLEVIDEIDNLIDEETQIIYTSGCKSIIKRWEESSIAEKSLIMKKLIKNIR